MDNSRTIRLAGREVPLVIRRSPRARRMALRIAGHDDSVELVLPPRMREEDGMDFLMSRAGWVTERLDRLPPRVPFADGAELPLGGVPHAVRHAPDRRVPVAVEAGAILVGGRVEHLPRRLGDWLRAEARRRIAPLAAENAAALGQTIAAVTLRDTRSRWGSCARGGRLSFSWRLVLAPDWVLRYVVAHEVAHLVQPNHSPAFWRVVAQLNPDQTRARDWLRRHGTRLHRYG